MGWTVSPQAVASPLDAIEARLLNPADYADDERPSIVARHQGREACYYAWRVPASGPAAVVLRYFSQFLQPAADGSYTSAIVVLYKNEPGGFGYKVMGEESGPYAADCSKELLGTLSLVRTDLGRLADNRTPEGRLARGVTAWRERVHAWHEDREARRRKPVLPARHGLWD